jgi:hypothetical protein
MKYLFALLFCTVFVGCGTQVPLRGQEREDYLKSIKAYGEFWTKPGMTKESWRQDWVACGGTKDGNYVAGTRLPGETDDFAASRRKTKQLASCMKEKGYAYAYTRS